MFLASIGMFESNSSLFVLEMFCLNRALVWTTLRSTKGPSGHPVSRVFSSSKVFSLRLMQEDNLSAKNDRKFIKARTTMLNKSSMVILHLQSELGKVHSDLTNNYKGFVRL